MEKEVKALEREGLITIEWVGPSNFTVSITVHGVEVVKEIEEGVWHKSVEALQMQGKEKHNERSILEEKGEHSYLIKDKTKVEEVGALPSDIMQTLDEQIIAERQAAYEEEYEGGVGVPVTDIMDGEGDYEGEEEVVERRIEGELDYSDSEEGEEIYLNVGEDTSENRIVQDNKSRIKRRVKERRISGELDSPDFDDEDAIPLEENEENTTLIDDGISEYHPTGSPSEGEYNEISSEIEEEVMQASDESELEDLSNLDLYKQIVDSISLDTPRTTEGGESQQEGANELLCIWESERYCPLKMKKDAGKQLNVTPNHCTVCQLIEIKKILKERED